MEQITLGQIGVVVTFLVGLVSGIGYLRKHLRKWIQNALDDPLKSLDEKIDGLHERIDSVDLESCKNFLVRILSDVEQGKELDEIERERFWEQYQHYEKLGGNSYIKRKVDQLVKAGKL